MMAFAFNFTRKKSQPPYWTAKVFRKLRPQAVPGDAKIFYAHRPVCPRASAQQKGLGTLFDSLDHTNRRIDRITVSSSDMPRRVVDLAQKTNILIGSHPMSDVRLVGDGVSGFHARLTIADGKLFVRELRSKAGVFLNGQRMASDATAELNQNSVMRIQTYCIRFESSGRSGVVSRSLIKERKPPDPADALFSSGLIHQREQLKSWSPIVTELTVTGIIEETEDVKTIRLTGRRPLLFHYDPGQYVSVIAAIDGREVRRSYSLASTPSRPNSIEITVKRLPGGLVSNWLCNHLEVGDMLKVKGPCGRFSCFNYPAGKLLFLAAGSGIVPIMSMLRWIVDTDARADVKLLLSFRTPADIIYRKELELFAARYDNIDLHFTITGYVPEWQGLIGRIDGFMLAETVPDLSQRQMFLCGPEPFMQSATAALKAQGAAEKNIHVEHFFEKPLRADDRIALEKIRNNRGKHRVRFAQSGLTVRCDETINLLELAEAHGIPVDNDCRTGSCGECMVRCLKGRADLSDEAEIDPKAKQAGWIYSCCAVPKSDVVLDL
jgi:ferredoxin-NADP reductase/pSer/pThr/pTyr-binding forkhead associated (FHA) protein